MKISLGKYQQAVYNGLKTNHLHSLKGFFFSVACVKLGYWQFTGKSAAAKQSKPGPASSSKSPAPPAIAPGTDLTLKQEGVLVIGCSFYLIELIPGTWYLIPDTWYLIPDT